MASKVAAIKFGPQDKSRIKGRVGHTRTGACTSRGRCQHGTNNPKKQGRKHR